MATITTSQAQQLLIAEARKHVGYNPGKTYSKFGAWYGWPNALWCAAFASKIFYDAFGRDAAVAGIGHEPTAPHKRGWIWTVAWRQWFLNHNQWVGVRNSQPGDLMFFRYPTSGDRNNNPVNHVDVVEANHYSKGYITTIGGNTPRPGTPGDPSNGRGCWRHNRSIHDRYIVAVYRPRWPALVAAYNAEVVAEEIIDLTRVAASLIDLGYPATQAGVRAYQSDEDTWGHNLAVDGIPGPATERALGESMAKIDDILSTVKQIHARQSNLDAGHNNIVRRLTEAIEKVPAAVWGYRNPGYPQRDAHGSLRDAATAKQLAAKERVLTQAQINDTGEES